MSGTILWLFLGALLVACTSSRTTAGHSEVPELDSKVRPAGAAALISVTRVTDGDSLRATGPDGDLEIRLLGINAPEADECLGPEATAQLESLLTEVDAVEIHPWPAERDEFGRTLSLVTAGDVFVNLAMIESGFAVARAQSDHGFGTDFEEAEVIASGEGRGIWAPDVCGPLTGALLSIVELNADAPGNDQENPNGEWVVIHNDGDAAVDLLDWSLRDESTRHRFEFPSVLLDPDQNVRVRTGCGENDLDDDPIELFWCDPEGPVWNNGGDTAFLLDPNGGTADYFRSN